MTGYSGTATSATTDRASRPTSARPRTSTVSRLMGSHSVKFGRRLPAHPADALVYGSSAGVFTFNQGFTQGPTPTTASTAAGDAIASFLLGYPATGEINVVDARRATSSTTTPAYIQDDFRDQLEADAELRACATSTNPASASRTTASPSASIATPPFPVQVPGLDLKGGLMYAGVDGNPDPQGQPLNGVRAARRLCLVAHRQDGHSRRLRPLLGADACCPASAKPRSARAATRRRRPIWRAPTAT